MAGVPGQGFTPGTAAVPCSQVEISVSCRFVLTLYCMPGIQIRVRTGKLFCLFLNKKYVVGTQKNRLNETVLLSTKTHVSIHG